MQNDVFAYCAHYTDGTVLNEIEPDGYVHGFVEIDQARLAFIELVPLLPHLTHHFLTLPKGSRPIFFRRGLAISTASGEVVPSPPRITCLGWQRTVQVGREQRNVKSVTFYLPDGSSVVADDADAVNFGANDEITIAISHTE